jgi:hypothetical protein
MPVKKLDSAALANAAGTEAANIEVRREEALLKTRALQNAILDSANFSIIAADEVSRLNFVRERLPQENK